MNLLERKTDFDAKVNKFLANTGNAVILSKPELYYTNYLVEVYKKEFNSVSHSTERNYVCIEFNKQEKEDGK